MLSLRLFLGRPRLLLPETSSLSDFAQMWLGSRLKQWPNHFSLLFSRKVSTGFTWASFLMSSFLMWSNLVFPLAHLNILISAEFSLLSSFFFTAQHSEPYVIAGLIIVLKTLSFNSTGIFLSHITPDTSFHFIHPIIILLLTLLQYRAFLLHYRALITLSGVFITLSGTYYSIGRLLHYRLVQLKLTLVC